MGIKKIWKETKVKLKPISSGFKKEVGEIKKSGVMGYKKKIRSGRIDKRLGKIKSKVDIILYPTNFKNLKGGLK